MTIPQRVAWVEMKLIQHGVKKVIPPTDVTQQLLTVSVREEIQSAVTAEALRNVQGWINQQVDSRLAQIRLPGGVQLKKSIEQFLHQNPLQNWKTAIDSITNRLVRI
jgi:hypothetical protein